MKKAIFLWVAFLIMASAQVTPAQRPRLEVKQDVVNLGELQEGEVVEHLFTFTNVGDATLQIFDTFAD